MEVGLGTFGVHGMVAGRDAVFAAMAKKMKTIIQQYSIFCYVGLLGFVFLCTQTWIEPRLKNWLSPGEDSYWISLMSSLIATIVCFIVGFRRLFVDGTKDRDSQ